ncbi:hypothetical protein [Methylobacterium trifolii]|uniref:Uncharacterized protein n=1 Tax=Methylobacterium trifolii TaxID=1003092 RepID=A0ABQ4U3P5_9HYPH|nr:hypothetical protein [Methylobacterium trifolii]GJE61824.1 hypothetical protein MPOCJGCO_3950 [Methylobacterium trifolii]
MTDETKPADRPAASKTSREARDRADPGPTSPAPEKTGTDGAASGGYETGQKDRSDANRKGGYGAG